MNVISYFFVLLTTKYLIPMPNKQNFPSTSLTAPHKRLCVSINQQQKRETWQSIDNIKLQYSFCSLFGIEIKNVFFIHCTLLCELFGCVKILIWVNVYTYCAAWNIFSFIYYCLFIFFVNSFSICRQGRMRHLATINSSSFT